MGELYKSRKRAEQVAESLGCAGAHRHQDGWMPCSTHSEYQDIAKKPHKGRGVLGIDTMPGGGLTSSPVSAKSLGVGLRAGRGIALNGQTQYALLVKLRHHNSENEDKSSLEALKKVYRRGVGSYGLTPRLETREQWGMKRVDQFLYLLRTGLPAEVSYVGDNDLLPEEHPWVVKSIEIREADFIEVKKIGRRLRRINPSRKRVLRAVFNAGARDADGDGKVQDGTEFERPATGTTPKIARGLKKRTNGAQRLAKRIRKRKRSVAEKVNIDSAIKSLQEKDGGFTVRLVDRTSMPSGWAIARDGQGVIVPKSTMFRDGKSTLEGRLILMAFIDEHITQLMGKEDTKDRTTALGAWHNPDTGLIHFDVTDVFSKESTSQKEAIRLGAERDQISIADLDKVKAEDWDNAFHESGGTGGDVIDPSSLEDKMRSLATENNVPGAESMGRDQLRPSTRIRSETGPEGIEMALAEPIAELASKHGEPKDWHGVVAIDMDRRKEIADFYDNAPNVSSNNASKEVIEAYEALAREVEEQYRMLVEQMQITVEFLDTDPYESFEEMRADFIENRRLKIMQTAVTGSHPLFTDEQNDMFRAVHDAFGHLATGRGFDRHGEEAAYQAHKTMFKELATKALATETRGQNQFLLDRGYFGDQKLVLLPEKMMKSLRLLMGILAKVAKSDRTVAKIQRDSDSDNGYTFTQSHHVTGGRVLKAQRAKPKSGNGRK